VGYWDILNSKTRTYDLLPLQRWHLQYKVYSADVKYEWERKNIKGKEVGNMQTCRPANEYFAASESYVLIEDGGFTILHIYTDELNATNAEM